MIRGVVGKLGAGKTAYAVREITDALRKGTPVVTNIRLVDGWAMRLARAPIGARIRGKSYLERRAARLESLYFFSRDLDELQAVELGCSVCGQSRRAACDHKNGFDEGRGLWVLDEAHENLNARTWSDEDRKRHVQWVSLARHRGWRVLLLTHELESLDRQIRARVTDYEVVRNLQQVQLAGIPLSPVPVFLVVRIWNAGGGARRHVSRRRVVMLDERSKLYDTHERADMHPDDFGADILLLPRPIASPPDKVEPAPVEASA